MLKIASNTVADYLTVIWNEQVLEQGIFPDELKLAENTPIFKKRDSTLAKNYRPVSI